MASVKQNVLEIAAQLPDDCTWDDAMYQLYVRSKIEQGIGDAEAGRVSDHDEVFEEFGM
jgi:predicted transcriptional regulator